MKYSTADIEKISPKIREVVKNHFDKGARKLSKGLFLFGTTGTGKTYTLYAIKKRATEVGVKDVSSIENWVEVLAEMRNNLNQSVNYALELARKDLVFIDDLGAEKSTDWSQEMLYLIVNRIYTDEKIPMFATNLSLEQFQNVYGDRIVSRLKEMCEFVELTGEDKRLEN